MPEGRGRQTLACTTKRKYLRFFQSDGNLRLVAVVAGNINLWSGFGKSEKVERFPVFIHNQTLPVAAHAREAQTPAK